MGEAAYISSYLNQLIQREKVFPPYYVPPIDADPIAIPTPSKPFSIGASPEAREDHDDEPIEDSLDLEIKSLKPRLTIKISIASNAPVEELKRLIAEQAPEFPAELQRLVFSGKGLVEGRTLDEYALTSGATVHLLKKAGTPAQPSPSASQQPQSSPSHGSSSAISPTATTIANQSSTAPTTEGGRANEPSHPVSLASNTSPESSASISAAGRNKDSRFWDALRAFLNEHFTEPDDAQNVFNSFKASYDELLKLHK
ncbi:hypothetical protein M427DRAFT_153767 [Gonapodya prolifera JEL478]|uniref:Ubiquitin-like domain-containing protein n=1 Tax=Gonapodya prolifera (strain JEL478) TaxID=1344416 RepID=A0A139AM90_GONPJ|nr:hypothetical protein M427DRAFT_153767 [Gonapodya prolifera JEL478]|eukprot:KXS17575.1 hypothetical protein M427DRAFT_153767 [Gonapodya prolifera JEL478]